MRLKCCSTNEAGVTDDGLGGDEWPRDTGEQSEQTTSWEPLIRQPHVLFTCFRRCLFPAFQVTVPKALH